MVLAFDLVMLFVSALLCQSGAVGFDGVLIPTIALFSSFGPVIALAALGSTLQNTFAAGNRVLDILDETPVVEEVVGKPEIAFVGAAVEQVTFSGEYAAKHGQHVLYVTERAVFTLTPEGVELTEIAPGVDLQKDVLDQMDFKPIVRDVKQMDERLFRTEPMGLTLS